MKRKVYYWIQNLKYKASYLWDVYLSAYCLSIIVLFLSLSNPSIAFLLPLSFITDILILICSKYIEARHTFSEMKKAKFLFTDLEKVNVNLTELYKQETSKIKMYGGFNQIRKLNISAYICKNIHTLSISYPFINGESIVLLHNLFDEESDQDRFVFFHEMEHCIGHSLAEQKIITTRIQTVILIALFIVMSVISWNWGLVLFGITLSIILTMIESPLFARGRTESEADNIALHIFKNCYGVKRMRDIANIFVHRYYSELSRRNSLTGIAFLLSEIKMMSCFLSTDDKQKFLVKLEDRAISEKGLDTFNSSFLSAWLRIQIWIIKRSRSFNMYEDIVVMWNPYLYYLIFPLFMVITY